MKARKGRLRLAAHLAACIAFASPPAFADVTKDQCIDANGKAQELRRGGQLGAAREQLRVCAAPACPALVRDDCTKRLDDLEKAQPTIVFDAKDASGRDLSAVKVTVDGRTLTETLAGTPLLVDPGKHVFTFEVPGIAPVTETFVVKESEKDRRERVVIGVSTASPAPQEHGGRLVVDVDPGATVTVDDKVVGLGRYDAALASGPHAVRVTEPDKADYKAAVDLRDGETRTLQVALEDEHHKGALWPWIVGGAVLVVGAAVGGYFLLKPSDTTTPVPPGKFGGLTFAAWRL